MLELGCGYGRLLAPLACAGHHVTGLDLDAGLLDLARTAVGALAPDVRARVTLVRRDMRTFDLGTRFDRVFAPFSTLYCLDSEEALLSCLSCVRAHLTPGGRLVFDAYQIDRFHELADPDDEDDDDGEPVASVNWDGRTFDVFETSTWARAAQRLHVTYRYQPRGRGEPRFGSIRHRYLLSGQIAGLCERAGLRLLGAPAGFDGAPLGSDGGQMVCTAVADPGTANR